MMMIVGNILALAVCLAMLLIALADLIEPK
jgi:hypothetical protein